MNTALVLIEFQNDYFPNGRMPLEKSIEACQKAQEALQIYRAKQLPVIHIQHISTRPDAVYFLPCTKGVELHQNVQPLRNETVIKKHYPNSFKDTGLLNHLNKNKINHLIIAGMMTHLAIDATVRAAYDSGFNCTVLHDACTTKNLEFNNMIIPAQSVQNAFLAAIQPLYANVISVKELLQTVNTRMPLNA
ncbi:MAG TPA: cysteine hydrolase family protein [Gammaproteobacteria bacterium]|nr:cysteine hydrolase family protein [Gammaproteobacteria bacterium]